VSRYHDVLVRTCREMGPPTNNMLQRLNTRKTYIIALPLFVLGPVLVFGRLWLPESPYSHISRGMNHDEVRRLLGAPTASWPLDDGVHFLEDWKQGEWFVVVLYRDGKVDSVSAERPGRRSFLERWIELLRDMRIL
jgi:hypothetical protein